MDAGVKKKNTITNEQSRLKKTKGNQRPVFIKTLSPKEDRKPIYWKVTNQWCNFLNWCIS